MSNDERASIDPMGTNRVLKAVPSLRRVLASLPKAYTFPPRTSEKASPELEADSSQTVVLRKRLSFVARRRSFNVRYEELRVEIVAQSDGDNSAEAETFTSPGASTEDDPQSEAEPEISQPLPADQTEPNKCQFQTDLDNSEIEEGPISEGSEQCDPSETLTWTECLARMAKISLYGLKQDGELEEHGKKSDIGCAVLFWVSLVVVTVVVLRIQVINWPQITNSYTTDDPFDNVRGGLTFSCGCSPPENAQNATEVNGCYQSSQLETVTALMYSGAVAEQIHQLIKDGSFTKPIKRQVEGGLSVRQEAHDIRLLGDMVQNSPLHSVLAPLYIGGHQQQDMIRSLDYFQSVAFSEFPYAYPRMSWKYKCINNRVCGLDIVNRLGKVIIPGRSSWVSCFDSEHWHDGEGKCVLYPPEDLPANFAVQGFLDAFLNLSGITNVWATKEISPTTANKSLLQPNILYLSVINVTSLAIEFSFLELEKGSGEWWALLGQFPHMGRECSSLPPVNVCDSTSICNFFRTGPSYDLRCLNATSMSKCRSWVEHNIISLDNVDFLTGVHDFSMADFMCPKARCVDIAPYLAIWSLSDRMENDPLNQFLASRYLTKEWARNSGVCINTYKNVIRYPPGTSGNDTMLLETKCTPQTSSQDSFCWPTGKYHLLSDTPRAKARNLSQDLLKSSGNRFVCSRQQELGFWIWFIGTIANVTSWISVVMLVYSVLVACIFVPLRRNCCYRKKRKLF